MDDMTVVLNYNQVCRIIASAVSNRMNVAVDEKKVRFIYREPFDPERSAVEEVHVYV